jgi:hypothetical protein
MLAEWLSEPASKNLIFRVAVREVEAWLLAHRSGFASFLGISRELVPTDVESLPDPKRTLISLARRSKRSELRKSIVPPHGSNRGQGPDYNGKLIDFVESLWAPSQAVGNSNSLMRTVQAIRSFKHRWPSQC